MNHQLPLPLYNTLYEFNQLHAYTPNRPAAYPNQQQQQPPYSPNRQASYPNQQQQQRQSPYPPIQQAPYPTSRQPPYSPGQPRPYPTSQLPTPYPTADTPYSDSDSSVEDLGHSDDDLGRRRLEQVEPSDSEESPEPTEPTQPANVVEPAEPAPALTFDERSRLTKKPAYKPRKRSHGDLHDVPPEGIDLSREHEDSFQPRDLLPPPERVYDSFDEAIAAVTTFGQAHGVSYNKNKWSRNMRQRLMMVCSRSGVHKDVHKEGTKRRNMGSSASKKCDCRMQFWILAMDYTNLEGQWRVKWANDRKSIVHNHPPQRPKVSNKRKAPNEPAPPTHPRIPVFKIA
ncbi:hypothetical protein IAQ61_010202 [Plenodomus lingam]|uniref:uncharacterized protein n=1 Tax=Leptosphaeria maculans TaxID=5022 RepID=UPI0033315B34|nr:hypothetical protein IAQ61_010202 [Plenodomus lingam]